MKVQNFNPVGLGLEPEKYPFFAVQVSDIDNKFSGPAKQFKTKAEVLEFLATENGSHEKKGHEIYGEGYIIPLNYKAFTIDINLNCYEI